MNKKALAITLGSLAVLIGAALFFSTRNTELNNTSNTTQEETVLPNKNKEVGRPVGEPASSAELSGTFRPVGEKTGSGGVKVTTSKAGSQVSLAEDFSVQDGPDLYIAFGNNGTIDPATLFTELNSTTGAQTYTAPESIDVSRYSQIFIYCKEFSTVFIEADLK